VFTHISTDLYIISDPPTQETTKLLEHRHKKRFAKTNTTPKKQKTVLSSTLDAKTSLEKCINHYTQQCCTKKCLWNFTMQQAIDYHQFYSKKSGAESLTWLTNLLAAAHTRSESSDVLQLVVDKKHLCQTGFKLLYGISNNKYYKALQSSDTPDVLPIHGNVNNQNAVRQTAREHMSNWLTSFVSSVGDPSPTDDTIYIPKYIPQTSLYTMYQNEWQEKKLKAAELPSPSSFLNIFHNYFTHVKFLKQTILGRCDFCMSIPMQKTKITSELDKLVFIEACKQHRELYTQERLLYSNRIHAAKTNPEQILHLVFDCPDGYDLPHVIPVTKESGGLPKLAVSAVGTINHSAQKRDYMFFLDEYRKNPNLILSAFYIHILEHFSATGKHPPILWLQSDNCFKENKNRWMMAFCCWLVHIGWFNEIMISMLPPGHTHIDVDQMFSTFSMYLDVHSVEFLSDLCTAVDKAYKKETTKPTSSFFPVVFNWVGFFAPFLQDISGLNSAHAFLFRKLSSGKIGMKVKQYHSTSASWTGSHEDPSGWMSLMHNFPSGFPEIVRPAQIEDMLEFDTIRKYNLWLTDANLIKWQDFLQEPTIPDALLYQMPDNFESYQLVSETNTQCVY
jgi:hypothetical protein